MVQCLILSSYCKYWCGGWILGSFKHRLADAQKEKRKWMYHSYISASRSHLEYVLAHQIVRLV